MLTFDESAISANAAVLVTMFTKVAVEFPH